MTVKDKFFKIVHDNSKLLKEKYHVKKIGIFGSSVSGREGDLSDVDVLVVFGKKTFDNYMDLKIFLEDALEKKVDLVMVDSIKPALKDEILKEVKYAA